MLDTLRKEMSLLVVIPFCKKDTSSAGRLLEWIKELGGCPKNDCLFVAAGDIVSAPIHHSVFKSESIIHTPFQLKDESHPIGPNWMFESTLKHLAKTGNESPFIWLEPDAIPLRKDWLRLIEMEYQSAVDNGKPILADICELKDARFPAHISSGVAV